MSAQTVQFVEAALSAMQTAYADYKAAESNYNASVAQVKEYQRQYDFFHNLGDNTNATNVENNSLRPEEQKMLSLKIVLDAAKAKYDTAKAEYLELKSTMLTETEQAQLTVQETTPKQNYAAKSSKYWIIGGIVLIVVGIGVALYLGFRKKA
jgi:hypothetical protein